MRDTKNLGETKGNDVLCALAPEAETIARDMPRMEEQVFPFTTDAVSAAFRRAYKVLG